MSRIFDALQRSVAENSRDDLAELSKEAEMLRRAERRTALKWEADVLFEETKEPKDEGRDSLYSSSAEPRVRTSHAASAVTEYSHTEESQYPFGQFQSLQVSLTPRSRLVSVTESGSPAAEAFRLLGVRLQHLRQDRRLKKILITSTIPQEGKSMVSANLACTLALKSQQRVLMLEGDLRRPSLAQMFGLGRNPGLTELLGEGRSLATSIYRLEGPNVWILPAGSSPSNALELLQSARLSTVMTQLTEMFDWIVIDSPPVLPLADTSVWMRLADGILLTARQGTTQKRQLQRGLEALESKKMIGALLNCSRSSADSDYYYLSSTPSNAQVG